MHRDEIPLADGALVRLRGAAATRIHRGVVSGILVIVYVNLLFGRANQAYF